MLSNTGRKTILRNLFIGVLLLLALAGARPAAAQSGEAYALIQMVNDLRADYGLPPYQIDNSLMAAAQAHSEWAASVGTHSHTGAGGSTPTDRAIAAGFGGGQAVRVSENIYWGGLATTESAFQWWLNSPIHFRGMTSPNYTYIGAGAAHSDSGGFYTLNFGVITGEAPPASAQGSSGGGQAAAPVDLPAYVVEPIELAEPNEDGSTVHVVGEGQNLWQIAEAYDVPLSEVLALNRLTEDAIIQPGDSIVIVPAPVEANPEPEGPVIHVVQEGQTLFGIALTYGVDFETVLTLNGMSENDLIFPGDEILIRPGEATPTPSSAPSTPTPTLTPTLIPTRTLAPLYTPTPEPAISGPPPRQGDGIKIGKRGVLIGLLAVLGVAGIGLVIAGLMSREG
jgi:LysM repeat protein